MSSGEIVPGVRKIAVLRANALGDFIFALPALDALRAAYPQAEIVLLGQPWHARFLGGRPGPVDRVVAVPPARGIHDCGPEDHAELERFFAAMRREQFDLALQLHGGGRNSNPFVRRLGARLTAGLKTPDAPPLDRWLPYVYFQMEVLRYLEVVGLLGAKPVGLQPRIAVTEADLTEARAVVPVGGEPLAVLHPGASDARRRWLPEQFAEVGDALAEAGARVLVTGTPSEAGSVEAVVGAMRAEAVNLCGRLSLGGLAGLLSRSALVVCNDTGPLHLAAAVGARTVGVYWCMNQITAPQPFRARHRPAVSWRLTCPDCGADCVYGKCEHTSSLVADVSPAEVIDLALELFAEARAAGPSTAGTSVASSPLTPARTNGEER